MNSFSGFIVGHQSAFRHGGTRGIAHHIADTSGNIFGIILVIIRLILGILRVNIEAISLLFKTVVYIGAEGIAEVVKHKTVQFILKGKTKTFKIKVVEVLDAIFDRIINQLRYQGMYIM